MQPVGLAAVQRLALRVHERDRVLRPDADHLQAHRRGDAGGVEEEERAGVEQPGPVAVELVLPPTNGVHHALPG